MILKRDNLNSPQLYASHQQFPPSTKGLCRPNFHYFFEAPYVKSCIRMLQKNSEVKNTEVLYVDGGSTDESAQRIAENSKLSHFKTHTKTWSRFTNEHRRKNQLQILFCIFYISTVSHQKGFDRLILEKVTEGVTAGCFQMRF